MQLTTIPRHPVLRTALLYGAGLGLLSLLWVVVLYLTGNNPYGPKRLMSAPLVPIVVVASQWFVRRYYPNGPGLGRAVGTGLLTALVAAAVSAATLYGFARAADQTLLERNTAEARQILSTAKTYYSKQPGGAQEYQLEMQRLAQPTPPQALAQDEFVKKMLLGFLLALPGGIFLRK